jgi:hypothetical protein
MRFEGFSTENGRLAKTVATAADTLLRDVTQSLEQRLAARGGHLAGDHRTPPVYFAALTGIWRDESEYSNMLYHLRDGLIRSKKLLIYIENELKPPTAAEIARVSDPGFEMDIDGDELRTALVGEALSELRRQPSPPPFTEAGLRDEREVRLLSWLSRCVSHPDYKKSMPEIPALLYYGLIGERETEFLHFCSNVGMDVLYISSDLSAAAFLRKNNPGGRMQVISLPYSKPVFPYPDKPVKAKFATSAYIAEREIDAVLYGGDVMFKDFQFSKNCARTLKTTYE